MTEKHPPYEANKGEWSTWREAVKNEFIKELPNINGSSA